MKAWLRQRKSLLLVLLGVLVAILVATSALPLKEWSVGLNEWLRSLGWWAIPAFIVIYVLVSVAGLPNIALILVAGTVFGLVVGIASASVADTLGAVVCFGLGRTVARKRVKKLMQRYPTFGQLDQAIAKKGWKILLLSRLSPIIPSNVLNYGFSCTKVNFWQYFFFTWLGMIPVIALYVYIGYFGTSIIGGDNSPRSLILQGGGLLATAGVAIYTTRLAKTALSQPDEQKEGENEKNEDKKDDG
ncbi:TVP38/TMEM64 family protein [Leptolyngbya sp. FACHB-671]|uniref:TVP38/TMEM64 family protein n=1 Tax=unclassified Leptolyngbya TaxID=2650499 RepID=UPI0016870F5D|nr:MULTISPECIES: TVP38/TMEM64 family protein [unclassified Leptolyngbya]MBD1997092.1 TVP38/TMEM64 family protein [Leptolyngbya sp. FACHB-541]MBD2069186.1 TVP38/TMEM64 family protein [Leptolyngbya sp. FACHB-671]